MSRKTRLFATRLEPRDVPAVLPLGVETFSATFNLDQLPDTAIQTDDVTGDGVADYRLTSPRGDSSAIISGSDGKLVGGTSTQMPTALSEYGGIRARSLAADVDGDGTEDIIIRRDGGTFEIFSGATGEQLIGGFRPYEESYSGDLYLAAGDFDGDGRAEIVTAPDQGGSARIQVFKSSTDASGNLSLNAIANFFAIEDPNYRGGASVAVGDFNGDGTPDLAVGALSGGPRVALFDGTNLGTPRKLRDDFFALGNQTSSFQSFLEAGTVEGMPTVYAQNLASSGDVPAVGVNLAAGDFNGDGVDDLAVGAGLGGGPEVKVFSGKSILDPIAIEVLADFLATGQSNLRTGVRVQTDPADSDNDGKADLLIRVGGFTGEAITGVKYLGNDLHVPVGLEPTGFLGGTFTKYAAGDVFTFTESW